MNMQVVSCSRAFTVTERLFTKFLRVIPRDRDGLGNIQFTVLEKKNRPDSRRESNICLD